MVCAASSRAARERYGNTSTRFAAVQRQVERFVSVIEENEETVDAYRKRSSTPIVQCASLRPQNWQMGRRDHHALPDRPQPTPFRPRNRWP